MTIFVTEANVEIEIDPERHVVVPITEKVLRDGIENGIKRQDNHQPSDRNYTRLDKRNPHVENVCGSINEMVFEDYTGLPMNKKIMRGGDGGVDFRCDLVKIGVMASKTPTNLFLRVDHVDKCSHFLVLSSISKDKKSVIYLGWETAEVMKKCPHRVFNKVVNLDNHHKLCDELRPMKGLFDWIKDVLANEDESANEDRE